MLLDKYLPEFHKNEIHVVDVDAPVSRVYPLVRRLDLEGSLLSGFYRGCVSIGNKFKKRSIAPGHLDLEKFEKFGFILLEGNGTDEIVIGLVEKVHGRESRIQKVAPEAFREFSKSGFAKAAWNFKLDALENGRTRITTETRVFSMDEKSRKIFGIYWLFVKPFSGLTRMDMLRTLKRKAESGG